MTHNSTIGSASTLPQKIQELTVLYEVSQELVSSLDPHEALEPILKILHLRMGMVRGTVVLLNPAAKDLAIEVAHGLTQKERERGRYGVGEGITGKVVETGRPVVVPDISQEPLFLNRTGSRGDLQKTLISFVCVPIKVETMVYGALSVDLNPGKDICLEDSVRLLTIIASMLAQSVRISQMLEEEKDRLRDENTALKEKLKERYSFYNIVGTSNRMREVFKMIEDVCRSEATVLIRGESGTGKELVANAIHYNSLRSAGPFIKVNCATLLDTLIESELFGHEKGAFTGAFQTRTGKFEQANKGTLFLDEIGTLNLSAQAKLLRALQEKEVVKVGGTKTIKVDVRIIAATNLDLENSLVNGLFREDLYYRINVFPIRLPALRERKTDISLLADCFLHKFNGKYEKDITRISTAAIDLLMNYHWPGNVRELENCIERAVLLCNNGIIQTFHLPSNLQAAEASNASPTRLADIQDQIEKRLIEGSLKDTRGNMAAASRALGTTERILGLRVKKYGIEPKRYRQLDLEKKCLK